MITSLPLLTSSRLKDARTCARLHRYKYVDGYRPLSEGEAVRFGSLFHLALEAWWLMVGSEPERAFDAALEVIEAQSEVDPFDAVKATELMLGYHYRWVREPLEVVAVERQFETDLLNPDTGAASRSWRLAGKVDGIVRDHNGRTLVVEHKTTSEDMEQGTGYWQRLRMDGQVSIYYEGARSLGYNVAGCLYDVIRKPQIRPLKATPMESRKFRKDGGLIASQRPFDETPEEFGARLRESIAAEPDRYYSRGIVVRLDAEMDEAMTDVWQTGQNIRAAITSGKHPRNPGACVQYGRTCSFFPVCCGEASLEDASLYRKSESVHPELETVSQ